MLTVDSLFTISCSRNCHCLQINALYTFQLTLPQINESYSSQL